MSKISQFLICFIPLLLGILLLSNRIKKSESHVVSSHTFLSSPSPTPTIQSISQYVLHWRRNSALVSSILVNEIQGKIIKIDTTRGEAFISSEIKDFKYDLKFIVKGKGYLPSTIYLTKDVINNKMKVFQIIDEKEIPISFNSLKVGDYIRIKMKTNMIGTQKDPEELLEVKITKFPD